MAEARGAQAATARDFDVMVHESLAVVTHAAQQAVEPVHEHRFWTLLFEF